MMDAEMKKQLDKEIQSLDEVAKLARQSYDAFQNTGPSIEAARFLEIILTCITERCDLLGLSPSRDLGLPAIPVSTCD